MKNLILVILLSVLAMSLARRVCVSGPTRRARALKRCRHRNRFVFYSCVYDASRGLKGVRRTYNQEAKALHSAHGRTCVAAGDPHMVSFYGFRWNQYPQQNRVLFQSGNVRAVVHNRWSRWGRRAIIASVRICEGRKCTTINRNRRVYGRGLKYTTRGWWVYLQTSQATFRVYRAHGYLNVYVVAKALKGCRGDCCRRVRGRIPHPNPFIIKFKTKCHNTRSGSSHLSARIAHFRRVVASLARQRNVHNARARNSLRHSRIYNSRYHHYRRAAHANGRHGAANARSAGHLRRQAKVYQHRSNHYQRVSNAHRRKQHANSRAAAHQLRVRNHHRRHAHNLRRSIAHLIRLRNALVRRRKALALSRYRYLSHVRSHHVRASHSLRGRIAAHLRAAAHLYRRRRSYIARAAHLARVRANLLKRAEHDRRARLHHLRIVGVLRRRRSAHLRHAHRLHIVRMRHLRYARSK